MKTERTKARLVAAMGSVMDISPHGDYSEYLPKGTTSQRIASSWGEAGKSLKRSIKHYETLSIQYTQ